MIHSQMVNILMKYLVKFSEDKMVSFILKDMEMEMFLRPLHIAKIEPAIP